MRSMHYYIKLAVVCASLGLTAIFGQAQEIAERNLSPLHWRYDVRVKRSADGKSLRFSLHVDAMTRLESQNVLVIYPSLVSASGDDRIDFAPVGIAGRIRYKAITRSKALGENSRTSRFDNELHPFSDIEEQGVSFQESVSFERWMADAHVTVREELLEMCDEEEQILKIAELCEIDDLLDRHPYDLSGGEQQRTALAKVMLTEPKILLLDEPTKGMDSFFKQKFARVLKRLQTEGVTVVMVSHDVEFCARYADLTGMFFDGSIVTVNTPEKFFARNSFYTTAANRMSRHIFQNAVNVEDVVELCRKNR